MSQKRIFNFNAGPATMPENVLRTAQEEMLNYNGLGCSVMEISHRSKDFDKVLKEAEANVRKLLNIGDEFAVLFLQGGASLQFAMLPMNLYQNGKPIDVIETGYWTKKAVGELKKTAEYRIVASTSKENYTSLPSLDSVELNPEASYVYMTSNNTIYGTQWKNFPKTDAPLVVDMSSDILSRRVDMNQFGVIFAGAQKNLGPAGVTLVVIRKDLAERAADSLPGILQYRSHIKADSCFNTPPTYSIYLAGLVLKNLVESGGLKKIEELNSKKAELLYRTIDESSFFQSPIDPDSRSLMNVVFRIKPDSKDSEALEADFVKKAQEKGMIGLKGHRAIGGLRASLYNALSMEAVEALVAFMKDFEAKNS